MVRDKAVDSLRSVAEHHTTEHMEEYFVPMIKRLASGMSRYVEVVIFVGQKFHCVIKVPLLL